jgi:hypothetical protein
MNLATTLVFYLLFGVAVAVAVYVSGEMGRGERWFRAATAILFWPLYVPGLLQASSAVGADRRISTVDHGADGVNALSDDVSLAIRQVEAELDLALKSLDGWSDAVWSREERQFEELRSAWYCQALKIRELDSLLAKTVNSAESQSGFSGHASDRAVQSERARRDNIAQLMNVRTRMRDDLFNTLSWVRELVTRIHLAKYTGAPASRAEELVLQIATAVEGLSEVAGWRVDEAVGDQSDQDREPWQSVA